MSLQIPKTSNEWINFVVAALAATGVVKLLIDLVKSRVSAYEEKRKRSEELAAAREKLALDAEAADDQYELDRKKRRDALLDEQFIELNRRIAAVEARAMEAERRAYIAEARASALETENKELRARVAELERKQSTHGR